MGRSRAGEPWDDGLNYAVGIESSSEIYYTGNFFRAGEPLGVDAITLLIEAVGVVILLMWIVIPIREFRGILKRVKSRHTVMSEPAGGFEGPARRDERGPRA